MESEVTLKIDCFCNMCGSKLKVEIGGTDDSHMSIAVEFCLICHEELNQEVS